MFGPMDASPPLHLKQAQNSSEGFVLEALPPSAGILSPRPIYDSLVEASRVQALDALLDPLFLLDQSSSHLTKLKKGLRVRFVSDRELRSRSKSSQNSFALLSND